jgi:outer membrane receptor protein involved in Fe transport
MKASRLFCTSALAGALALGAGAASAQEQGASRQLDEIIVTAQKREQSLQDVPIVVTTLNQTQLQNAGVRDIKDLTILTPGLLVTSTSNETVTTARIRGVGTVGDNPGLESSVGVVIDGIYRPRNGVGFGDLGEIQRIEVLKGPQGTLFGKNTSAGVINILTAEPRFDFGANAEITVGNYDAKGIAASVTGPLMGDKVAGRLFFARRERDGFYTVNVRPPRTERRDNDQNFYTLRGQLLATPTEDLTLRFIADYTKRDENCCLAVNLVPSPLQAILNAITPGGAVTSPPNPFARVVNANRPTDQEITDQGVSLEANWDTPWLGGATLTSITGWRNWETVNGQDSDFSGADILYRNPDGSFGREFGQLSQEIRLAGGDERFNWLVGAFAAREDLKSRETLVIGTQLDLFLSQIVTSAANPVGLQTFTGLPAGQRFPAGAMQSDTYDQEGTTFALFTNNSFKVTEQLELTVGLRYTIDDKTLDAQYRNFGGTPGCAALLAREAVNAAIFGGGNPTAGRASTGYQLTYGYGCSAGFTPVFNGVNTHQEREEKAWSGTAKATYRWTPDIMTYASYARGFKAGGFNLDRSRNGNPAVGYTVNPDTSFKGEYVDSYELGAKTTWLDNTLLLNASAFYQTFEDFQLNTFTGISFIVASLPEVVSRGVDADMMWVSPIEGLSFNGGVTYAETQYGDFPVSPGVSARLPNTRLSFAPKWSSSASANWERDIAGLRTTASINYRYTSSYNTGSDLSPLKMQKAIGIVNARVGVGSPDERYTLELWAQNLTGVDYLQVAFDATLQVNGVNAFLAPPRTVGATVRLKY